MKVIFLVSFLIALLVRSEDIMPFKDQCLYWHNYFRTLHQVPSVTWSTKLQKEAQDWADYLAANNKFHHSPKNPGNLYLSAYKPREYCSDAIWWFHNEEKYYNYSNPRYVVAAGHFTQLIWKNSKQIGAAFAVRKDKRLVVSIKYKPGGNVIGYFKKNVLPPTASLLGPEWARIPPKFARCPILTPTGSTEGSASNVTQPYVKGSAGIVGLTLELFTGSFILATLFS
ncbi:Golgi-associated plant pathogenesis-related protein 1-like isoform X2 [Orbicella faveolata]|uniref:Golgi-associated plant pathogenesis-related protein 1-like isoform X2 n=1 Tax=Orbicella faveolata TaxID=48498 RepID=UPI0009E5FA8E|nr:Golgi-associated plant pathogenesis-related protein 1-like isoform X2 [Orbicella faveolata]